ncbi:c-type cytochrome biogenesis protein CcmI [Aliiglaciecola sp. LCG003]|uniref:c-type cytochrome biogenesis protein CcmI n=1 Tax=Aliiglaciecola sp. LCG003 TaxID=3053655 RepID=UPI0025722E4E|nr:c-type cytochrome biogenesis protein CcmI [Aliiglaciecola sp. LCG003]WJG08583.1 c-type cytochrome biogenesis protein CcmI [Aliiglaciecola sp. LCG003]
MSNYWFGVALLSCVGVLILVFPWIRRGNRHQQDVLTNTQIIRQRMLELEREVGEGLIAAEDKDSAVKELKLALVDENQPLQNTQHSASGIMLLGLVVALSVCGWIYYKSNEVQDIASWQQVTQHSSELAKRIVVDADPSVTVKDLEDFALAMRTKLLNTPDDHIGWLLLGRIHASLNRLDSALQAFEKAYALAPNHGGVLSSYSQTLVLTGEESYLRQAEGLIRRSIELDPNDYNALGMLAVTSTQLGETQQAIDSWRKLQQKLSGDDPMQLEIQKRIAALSGDAEDVAETSVMVAIDISQELKDKLPENAFLIVFAQDANSDLRMPAAVVKSRLANLPVQVRLSDANAMMPTFKLSQLTQARLVARISIDENVAPASGDLQGEVVVTLQPGKQFTQKITIDKELL